MGWADRSTDRTSRGPERKREGGTGGGRGKRGTLRDLEESDSSCDGGEETTQTQFLDAKKDWGSARTAGRGPPQSEDFRYTPSPPALPAESISMLSEGKEPEDCDYGYDRDDDADSLLLPGAVARGTGDPRPPSAELDENGLSTMSLGGGTLSQYSHQSDLYDFVGLSTSRSEQPSWSVPSAQTLPSDRRSEGKQQHSSAREAKGAGNTRRQVGVLGWRHWTCSHFVCFLCSFLSAGSAQ